MVRHGDRSSSQSRYFKLSDIGKQRIESIVDKLQNKMKGVVLLLTSPEPAAAESTTIIARILNLKPEIESLLFQCDFRYNRLFNAIDQYIKDRNPDIMIIVTHEEYQSFPNAFGKRNDFPDFEPLPFEYGNAIIIDMENKTIKRITP